MNVSDFIKHYLCWIQSLWHLSYHLLISKWRIENCVIMFVLSLFFRNHCFQTMLSGPVYSLILRKMKPLMDIISHGRSPLFCRSDAQKPRSQDDESFPFSWEKEITFSHLPLMSVRSTCCGSSKQYPSSLFLSHHYSDVTLASCHSKSTATRLLNKQSSCHCFGMRWHSCGINILMGK